MKKWIAMLLSLVLVLGLCACQGGEQAAAKGLQVGYGRVNITPSYSVPLAGYGNTSQRMSQGFLDYIYVTCIAVTDENDSTVLLITCDTIAVQTFMVEDMKKAVMEATGVPADRIFMQGTHTHSAPDVYNGDSSITKFKTEYIAGVAKAAADAMADRSPATMETGVGHTEGLNFVRHYTTSAGGIYGDNLVLPEGATITGHVADSDNEFQLLCFRRAAEDKKDILAMNWQCHPKLNSSGETAEGKQNRSMISADYIGGCRDYIEQNTDFLFAFYLGAAGNLNANSKITTENVSTEIKSYSAALGQHVIDGIATLKPVEGTTIKSTQQMYEVEIDHSEDHLVAEAQRIAEVWSATNNRAAAMEMANPDTVIGSPYHANSIVSRAGNKEGTRKIEINALCIGPIGFVTAPYEMFDKDGMFIKDGSPFETTFVMTCANGGNNYIASEYAFENGGTYEVHNRTFPKGTAEALANNYVEMLKSLQG